MRLKSKLKSCHHRSSIRNCIINALEIVFNLPKESFAAKKLVYFLAHHTVLCADQ